MSRLTGRWVLLAAALLGVALLVPIVTAHGTPSGRTDGWLPWADADHHGPMSGPPADAPSHMDPFYANGTHYHEGPYANSTHYPDSVAPDGAAHGPHGYWSPAARNDTASDSGPAVSTGGFHHGGC